jgi:2-dehydropantoate 2-reductase
MVKTVQIPFEGGNRNQLMEPFKGRIGIVGSGALGAFYGSRLFRAGHDVHFLMRRDYEEVRANGLRVRSIDGDFHIRPPVWRDAGQMGVCDLVIVGMKTTDTASLPALLAATTDSASLVLTLQNGLGNEDAIAAMLGGEEAARRVLGGAAFLCSTRPAPGIVEHTDHGFIRIAEFRGPALPRTQAVAELFRSAGISCECLDSLLGVRWAKLVWNIPFNGLGVAAEHADAAAVLADDTLRGVARRLMEEVIAAAVADGVALPPDLAADMMQKTTTMGAYRSSMQIDFESGRPLEVEAILGEPLRRARRAGIEVPTMELLYGIVRRRDRLARESAA